ncbi:hypothetical protein Clacol_000532 [Clathrus columnatus]|uniref:Transglycosylase SLT domain-containing protein n=1 Tax=Clathrus columnatus TaxID=1419009 RepID=A0AAV4ZZZ3_9AGAM|nr:hypothetical protein Clacol_000532 [Clathrus columnatus]
MQVRVFLAFLALSLVAHASLFPIEHKREHTRLARRAGASTNDVNLKKRCKTRPNPDLVSTSVAHATKITVQSTKPKPTSTYHTTTKSPVSKPSPSPAPKPAPSGNVVNSGLSGLLEVISPQCGHSGATKEITISSGPNGAESWLNCGVDGSGWNPPEVSVDQLIVADLDQAINDPGTPFKPCTPYIPLFKQYGKQFNIPPILLASIAMQESTCNPGAVGGAGEQGLMQITKDKCVGAPGGDCQNPNFNVETGAKFFSTLLQSNKGNVLATIGQYNGWKPKMTIVLHDMANGWLVNVDPRAKGLGLYHNLAICD